MKVLIKKNKGQWKLYTECGNIEEANKAINRAITEIDKAALREMCTTEKEIIDNGYIVTVKPCITMFKPATYTIKIFK